MRIQLVIDDDYYGLSAGDIGTWTELSRLAGGYKAILANARGFGEGAVELAIERTEDWVMPHVSALRGTVLEVVDGTGRFTAGMRDVMLTESASWNATEFESLFLQMVHMLGRPALASTLQSHQGLVADMVVVRELIHHAQLHRVQRFAAP